MAAKKTNVVKVGKLERAIYSGEPWSCTAPIIRRIRHVLDRGGDPNEPSEIFGTALHAAAHLPGLDIVRVLVERGADVHARDRYGRTPAQAAADWGHKEIAAYLISCSPAEPTPRDGPNHGQ